MAQQMKDLLGRMGKGPAGLSTGIKLLIGFGALGYGVKESLYTGIILPNVSRYVRSA